MVNSPMKPFKPGKPMLLSDITRLIPPKSGIIFQTPP